MTNPTLVILAAGGGTRYGGLKQLAPVGPNGETLLEYSSFDALRNGFGRVVLVVRPETERGFRERLDGGLARRMPVSYAHQETAGPGAGIERTPERGKPWGTGQAVLAARSELDGPFAVINADDFYGVESYQALASFLAGTRDERCLAAVGFRLAETLSDAGPVSRGLLEVDGEGRLREIVEALDMRRQDGRILCSDRGRTRALSGDERVSMNMWGFGPELLPELERSFRDFLARSGGAGDAEFMLPEAVGDLIRERRFRVEVLPGAGEWCGLTFREDHRWVSSIVAALIERGRYPEALWG